MKMQRNTNQYWRMHTLIIESLNETYQIIEMYKIQSTLSTKYFWKFEFLKLDLMCTRKYYAYLPLP